MIKKIKKTNDTLIQQNEGTGSVPHNPLVMEKFCYKRASISWRGCWWHLKKQLQRVDHLSLVSLSK